MRREEKRRNKMWTERQDQAILKLCCLHYALNSWIFLFYSWYWFFLNVSMQNQDHEHICVVCITWIDKRKKSEPNQKNQFFCIYEIKWN